MIYNIYNLRAKGKLNILDFLLGHGWSNTCINEAIQNTYGSSKPYSLTYGSHVEWLRITYWTCKQTWQNRQGNTGLIMFEMDNNVGQLIHKYWAVIVYSLAQLGSYPTSFGSNLGYWPVSVSLTGHT